MSEGFTEQDAALLDELGVEVTPRKAASYTVREERIIAGFEEIQRFVDSHGRVPERGDDRSLFERLYAVRLGRILADDEWRELVAPLDRQALLSSRVDEMTPFPEALDDNELLTRLRLRPTSMFAGVVVSAVGVDGTPVAARSCGLNPP